MAETTFRLKCTCKSDYQDKKYGKQVRLHNLCGKADPKITNIKARCTVCKVIRGV